MDFLNSPWMTLAVLVADVVIIWILVRDFRAMRRIDEHLDRLERNAKELDQLMLRKKPDQHDDTIPF